MKIFLHVDALEDFEDEDFADLDCEEVLDDSLAGNTSGDNTITLVNDIEMEQGIQRGLRSPSPEGSASDFSDSESVISKSSPALRKVKDGKVKKAESTVANIAVEALMKLANVKSS